MRRDAIYGLIAALLFSISSVHAQQAAPSAPKVPEPQIQQAAPAEPPKAKTPPVVIDAKVPPVADQESYEAIKERTEKAELDRRLVELTGDLARFTAGLFWATVALAALTAILAFFAFKQSRDMKKSLALANKAADAADKSARAAIGLELPIIRMIPDNLISGSTQSGDELIVSYAVSSIVFANYGRTSAFPIEVKSGMIIGDELPPEPRYSSNDMFAMDASLDPTHSNQSSPITREKRLTNCVVVLREGEHDKIHSDTTNVWLYCSLVYRDFMDERREVGLCWRLTRYGYDREWRPDTTPAYNRKT